MESKLRLDCALKCVSLLRNVSACLDSLRAGVANSFLVSNDVPLLLAEVLTTAPWCRDVTSNDERGHQVYVNGRWRQVTDETAMDLVPSEAQAWIALVQTLLGCKAAVRYVPHHRLSVLSCPLVSITIDAILILAVCAELSTSNPNFSKAEIGI
jgi:hypothetical protein